MRRLTILALGALLPLLGCSAESGNGNDTGTDVIDGDADGDTTTTDGGVDTDSDAEPDTAVCVDEDQDGYGPGCALGPDCADGDSSTNPGATETCGDGIDNDCNGTPDDGCSCSDGTVNACYPGDPSTNGVGACQAGTSTCVGDQFGACSGAVVPSDEVCDGLDNDCDRETDEGVSNACGTCGEVPLEICDDGLDNDCNGTIDDATAGCSCGGRIDQPCYSGRPQTRGVGQCIGGTMDCIEGAWGTCEGESVPVVEVCDGLDDDCDGAVDEGLRNACGDCALTNPPEICDDIDNDCDGAVDEGVRGTCGLCPDEITSEECGDGFDNNCDGNVDEGCTCAVGDVTCYPGPPGTEGVGACTLGDRACDPSGEFWGSCENAITPSPEVCDGIDNDCDGQVDIAPSGCSVCGTDIEICDGMDNDCDGREDELLRNACGVCLSDVVPEAVCDGVDDDCNGLIDEGLLSDCGTCDPDECGDCEFFLPGWSADERCGDGQDNNEDGVADEGCPCEFGATQSCFLGAPNSRRIGACLDGTQSCVDRDDPRWGPCEGGIVPSAEICDGKDNDCNGCIDEGECNVTIMCPIEDTIKPLRDYELIGSSIYAGDDATAWEWVVVAPDNSSTTGAANPNSEDTSFFADVSGDYEVTVNITINGEVVSCTFIVHVRGLGLRVELVWDTQGDADIDLHLHNTGDTTPWCDLDQTCYYRNCDDGDTPGWGYADSVGEDCPGGTGTCGNPRLDIDNISDVDVPENINLDNPNDGDTFRIMVHYYSGSVTTHPALTIYCGGVQSAVLGGIEDQVTLNDSGSGCQGDTWRAADVTMFVDDEGIVTSCDVDVLQIRGDWDVRNDNTTF